MIKLIQEIGFTNFIKLQILKFAKIKLWNQWQVVLIVLVVLILFGGKKIPELMKGLGKGMKEFKDATKEIDKDKEKSWVEKQKIFFTS